jgi:arylsulfatase A-like enzyme
LDNTYVFVLSDNGYTVGHHRRIGKTAPYDESVRIPMYVAGPGFAAGAVDNRLVANIDIGPTIADAAGAPLPEADGFSLLQPTTRDELLLEWNFVPTFDADDLTVEAKKGKKDNKKNKEKNKKKRKKRRGGGTATGEVPDYLGLRTLDRLYVVYESGERELYQYDADPYELDNLLATWEGHTPSAEAEAIAAGMASRLEELHDCAGASCR